MSIVRGVERVRGLVKNVNDLKVPRIKAPVELQRLILRQVTLLSLTLK